MVIQAHLLRETMLSDFTMAVAPRPVSRYQESIVLSNEDNLYIGEFVAANGTRV